MLAAAFCGDELEPGRCLFAAAPIVLDRRGEVREGRMPSPARRMRALPRVVYRRVIENQARREWRRLQRRLSQRRPSTRPSDELSESAASAEARMLRAHRESGKTRGYRARSFPWDRKVARRRTRVLAVGARVASPARANHRVARTRSIQ